LEIVSSVTFPATNLVYFMFINLSQTPLFALTISGMWPYVDTCPENDVSSFSRKGFCPLEWVRVRARV